MVALLDIAYCSGHEAELAEQIEIALDAGHPPDPDVLRAVFFRDAGSIHVVAGFPAVAVTTPRCWSATCCCRRLAPTWTTLPCLSAAISSAPLTELG
jgi:hypothetical protein